MASLFDNYKSMVVICFILAVCIGIVDMADFNQASSYGILIGFILFFIYVIGFGPKVSNSIKFMSICFGTLITSIASLYTKILLEKNN